MRLAMFQTNSTPVISQSLIGDKYLEAVIKLQGANSLVCLNIIKTQYCHNLSVMH